MFGHHAGPVDGAPVLAGYVGPTLALALAAALITGGGLFNAKDLMAGKARKASR